MKNIAIVFYRDWALDIFRHLKKVEGELKAVNISQVFLPNDIDKDFIDSVCKLQKPTLINANLKNSIKESLNPGKVDVILFIGWSWIVCDRLISDELCIGMHPSLLPMYAGGSPIQHQILAGDNQSGLTVFKMTGELDRGPIYKQETMSLAGDINDIFQRMSNLGRLMLEDLLVDVMNDELIFHDQPKEGYSIYRRRLMQESEFLFGNLILIDFITFKNFVRSLTYPYPNAFIALRGGTITINKVYKFKRLPDDVIVIDEGFIGPLSHNCFLQLRDCYALIIGSYESRVF